MSSIEPKWLRPEELAEQTGLDTDQLSKMRINGTGPEFVKFGRQVRYLNLDVLRWHQANRQTRTSG